MMLMDLRHIRHQKTGTENGYLEGGLTGVWLDRCASAFACGNDAANPKQEVSEMEVRHRIQQGPTRAIVLVLAVMAAVVVALAVVGVRVSVPTHPQNSTVAPLAQVVGSGMEPDTRDAYS